MFGKCRSCEGICEEDLVLDNGHLLNQVLNRSGILPRIVHKEPGIILRSKCYCRKRTSYIPCNDSVVQGSGQKQRRGKLSFHFTADQDTVDTIYRIILSVNQLSVYGAAAAICEEFGDRQDGTGQLVILVGQSIVLGEVKAETFVHDEDPMNDQIIWQRYIQQVDSLSLENRVSRCCKEAGFMRVVEV